MTMKEIADKITSFKPMAIYYTHNGDMADDVIQELFLKIHRRYQREGNVDFMVFNGKLNEGYIFTMIRSCYMDMIRKEKKYSDTPSLVESIMPEQDPSLLTELLKGLTWYEKELTRVYFEEEHSIRSLAKATKISSTNIHLTLKKTKSYMKDKLNQEVKKEIDSFLKEKARSKPKTRVKKKAPPSKGLGDTVEKITKKTGIKKLVELFTPEGEDCGCDKRKEILNKVFPYKKVKCMTEQQFNLWEATVQQFENNQIKDAQLKVIAKLHSEIFGHDYFEPCRCEPKTWKNYINDIDKVYNTYEK